MPTPETNSGGQLAICTTVQNDDLDDHATNGFPGLTYVNVSGVGSIGEIGIQTNIVSYDTWDEDTVRKAKGMTDAGSPDIEMLRKPADAGQIAMRTAGAISSKDSYAFKVTRPSGLVEYFRAIVAGPRRPNGRNEDFVLEVYTLGLQQAPVVVEAP